MIEETFNAYIKLVNSRDYIMDAGNLFCYDTLMYSELEHFKI